MYRILFVCHGNICRSPMAEFVFNDMLKKRGLSDAFAESAATSPEELGSPIHRGTAEILRRLGIDFSKKRARQLSRADGERFDLIVGMDGANIRNISRILGEKHSAEVCRLLDLTESPRDVADPWYTGDFEQTYRDVCAGCEALIRELSERGAL